MTIGTILRHFLLVSEFDYFFFFHNNLFWEKKQAWENAPKPKQVHEQAKKKRQKQKKDTKVISSLSNLVNLQSLSNPLPLST